MNSKNRKFHSALNCYDRLNLMKFPPAHSRELSPFGPMGSNHIGTQTANLVWYPDSRSTSHITTTSQNMQQPCLFTGNECILTANRSPLPISNHGKSVVCSSKYRKFILEDLLIVPTTSKNLLSVNKFCSNNDVHIVFDSQRVQVCDPATKEVLME